ncbi:MAG: hypothetical protein ACRDRL_22825 [Sciscionella sp.]
MPLSINDVKVVKISQVQGLDQSNRPTDMIAVQWTIGAHGPFTDQFPKAGFDQNAALQTIKDTAMKFTMFPTA